MKKYYKNGIMGGSEKDREEFYNLLHEVENNAISTTHEYSGDYSVFNYELKNGKAIYTVNDNYGIPESIEIL